MSWKDKAYNVLFLTGHRKSQVGQLPWVEAEALKQKGAARFISNILYRAAKAGVDIIDIKKPDEDKLKQLIASTRKVRSERKEKQEKKRERKRDKKEDEVKEATVT